MSSQAPYITATAVTVGVLGGAYYAYKAYQESQRTKLPEQWTEVGRLKTINVYPIKSCGPVDITQAECTTLGLKQGWLQDRVLMVVDKKDNFVTARAHPELLLVSPIVRNSVLSLRHSDMEIVNINLAEIAALKKQKKAKVWGVTVPVYDCGFDPSEWFSRLLDHSSDNYRLVYYASQKSRQLRPSSQEAKIFKFGKNDAGALPDETPFNLINEASVEDLNSKIPDCQVTYRNFRPNFVLEGAKPYEEDNWKFVKIGDNIFEIIKPCTRCIMTTIDPETGVRSAAVEPLETLKSYRQITDIEVRKVTGTSPRMGVQLALRSGNGQVTQNDVIYVA